MLCRLRTHPWLPLACSVILATSISGCGSNDDEPAPPPSTSTPAPAPAPAPVPAPVLPQAASPDLYVFGDSLSDTGNLGRPLAFGSVLPLPFFENRISNGKVIVDYLADAAGKPMKPSNYLALSEDGTNYAIAGARVIGSGPDIDLSDELQSFSRKNDARADPVDNYVFFIGGNDVIAAESTPNAIAMLDAAALELSRSVQTLVGLGARKFYILNVPDIGRTPQLLEADAATPGRATAATALTQYFNNAVASQLATIAAPGVSIVPVDVFSIFNSVLARSVEFGFTDTTRACYVIDTLSYNPFCNASLIDTFFFFDKIHPSARTHRLIGEEIVRQIGAGLR